MMEGLATDFKGDTRIRGFELANEPYSSYWLLPVQLVQ